LRKYRKNQYPPIEDSLKRRIYDRWQRTFEQYGYPHDLAEDPASRAVPAPHLSAEPVKVA